MMNFNEFCNMVLKELEIAFPEEKAELHENSKVNVTYTDVHFLPRENNTVSPSVHLDCFYDDFCRTGNFSDIIARIVKVLKENRCFQVSFENIFDNCEDKIVFQVINAEKNQEYLKNHPHKIFEDLAIIFRIVIKKDPDGMQSLIITNEIQEKLGIDVEALLERAIRNTRNIMPPHIEQLSEKIHKIVELNNLDDEEIAYAFQSEDEEDEEMWILTNTAYTNGAGYMLYEDIIHDMADKYDTNFCILPSSIHECLLAKIDSDDPEMIKALSNIVHEVNVQSVPESEFLSDSVYYYDRETRKIKRVA